MAEVYLVKPVTYMNLSGEALASVCRFYRIPPDEILVIYDDMDLPLGRLRFRKQGSSGGHNGIKSIIKHLNTQNFPRLRVGIGRPPGRMEPKDYVLQDFGDQEYEIMAEVYARIVEAVESFIQRGVKQTMNRYNIRPRSGDGP